MGRGGVDKESKRGMVVWLCLLVNAVSLCVCVGLKKQCFFFLLVSVNIYIPERGHSFQPIYLQIQKNGMYCLSTCAE